MKFSIALLFFSLTSFAGSLTIPNQEQLRGGNGPGRDWWDVRYYDLDLSIDEKNHSLSGTNTITFAALKPGRRMQIDLQAPMKIESVHDWTGTPVTFTREGNVYWLDLKERMQLNQKYFITIDFLGVPKEAKKPPWDGGWIWTKDEKGRPWLTVACQGLGASVWYPTKDTQADEPDDGARVYVAPLKGLTFVGNGRNTRKNTWAVKSTINNYNITPYLGHYENWKEVYQGVNGPLDLDFWALDYDVPLAKIQFAQTKPMLAALEHWFGPYPFYKDGFKLVEAPYLGMEHQSAIAYGNKFKNGYLGKDRSESGWGEKFDFIIIHEAAHEWFGNSITAKDLADMWIHEAFANYAESLFVEYHYGKLAGDAYCLGNRKRIKNDKPIIADYGVNQEGSGDMYDKGGNLIHMLRQLANDDNKFLAMLRGLNKTFFHQTVTSNQIESFIAKGLELNLSKVFDQYLRNAQLPVLEHKFADKTLSYRWSKSIAGFDMAVKLKNGTWLQPTTEWQSINFTGPDSDKLVDERFLVGESRL